MASRSPVGRSVKSNEKASSFGPVAAGVAALALALPFALWGNPYPRALWPYWLLGSLAAAVIGFVLFKEYDRVALIGMRILATPASVFVGVVALVALMLSVTFALYSFHGFGSTSDEIAQLWHARILLTGRWALPVDPNREFFSLDTVVDSGRWYSQFPVGGPLIMTIGALIHAPWLINPLLAAGSVIGVYLFTRRAYGEAAARWASALYATAPMVLMMAGTWMNHVPVLFFTTTALAAVAAWDQATTRRQGNVAAAVIGFCVGAIATIRPLDAVVAALVLGAFQASRLRQSPRRASEVLVQVAAGAIPVLILLLANWHTTGAPLRFGYEISWGPGHRVGFHPDPYGEPHTLFRGLDYVVSYFSELNIDLLFWPLPALLVLILGLFANRRPSRWDVFLVAYTAAQTLAYGAYWYRGELLGPRFLYPIAPAVIILISRTPSVLDGRFGVRACRVATVGIIACVVVAWSAPTSTVGVLGLASHTRGQRQSLKTDVAGAVREAGVHHALVFLREQFSQRLVRRLWALGVARGAALQLVQTRDACALLTAIENAENDAGASPVSRIATVASVPPVVNPEGSMPGDPAIHIASRASLTPACEAEVNGDVANSPMPFGAGLVLEPIDANGRIDGDVIYVADLGAHNEVLRTRFGDRRWYRLRLVGEAGHPRPVLAPY